MYMDQFEVFKQDIRQGLSAEHKYIPSKYFYDDSGSRLFQEIMRLPEYYLTDCEVDILKNQKDTILRSIVESGKNEFDLIELGAGDGTKTRILLHHLIDHNVDFTYLPVDISEESNVRLYRRLKGALPDLPIETISDDYFGAMETIMQQSKRRKVLLFLGSNIGNFSYDESLLFFRRLAETLEKGDLLIVGFDLIKDREIILNAYNDSSGVTRDFNLNLLKRLNRELNAHFDLSEFEHHPVYDEVENAAKSYLKSKKDQFVAIRALDIEVKFRKDELIFTEISRKYSHELIGELAAESGFSVVRDLIDSRNYFTDSIWIFEG
jgi:dimethylhistidine N-methyltransferase